jgi:hypothetical protein
VEVLTRVFTDTLDVAVRADIERHGVRRAAELTLVEVAGMPGGRGWWRPAVDAALHRFAEAGEAQVTDGTDAGNDPIAAAFARSGYRVTGRCVILA